METKKAKGFVVKYKINGFDGERTTGIYYDELIAQSHADDIQGYEGVQYAIVVKLVESPDSQ
jgi:hypothetical protein